MRRKDIFLSMLRKAAGIDKDPYDLDEQEILKAGREANERAGINKFSGTKYVLSIPPFFESEEAQWLKSHRDIGTEAYLIQDEPQYLLPPTSDRSVFARAGSLFLHSPMKNVFIPYLSGILCTFLDDDTEPISDGDPIEISGATFSNKRLYLQLDVPRILIERSGIEFDKYLRGCISAAISDKLDSVIGGVLAGSTNKPQGMGYAITTGLLTKHAAITPSANDLSILEQSLKTFNFPVQDMAYITSPDGRRILRDVQLDPGNTQPAYKDEKICDYPAYISNAISSIAGSDGAGELLLFGNWKNLCIMQFGAFDLVIDPYTLKRQAKIQINCNSYWDVKSLLPAVATSEDGSTEPNNYAGFASLAIK